MSRYLRLAGAIAVLVTLSLSATVAPLEAQADSTAAPTEEATLLSPTDQAPPLDIGDPVAVPLPPVFPGQRTKVTDCVSSGGRPDPACTPGVLDPRVTQDNISNTICVSGYTARVRPSTSVTNRIKVQQMVAYGVADQLLATVELDHLIPLELGGATDVANLWPEPWVGPASAREKDRVENFLHGQVCGGALALTDAQQRIVSDWYAVYLTLAAASTTTTAPPTTSSVETPQPLPEPESPT